MCNFKRDVKVVAGYGGHCGFDKNAEGQHLWVPRPRVAG
jgi:hypothetical protein